MNVLDLVNDPALSVELKTTAPKARSALSISSCSPTELLDPTPFLEPHSLLLTSGIGMNFSDERTWDAYVERLAKVQVAAIAFSTGIAHHAVPPGLIAACERRGTPLIEVPSTIPSLQLLRRIENILENERMDMVDQGWALADKCARLANQGADVASLLVAIFDVIDSPLAVYDSYQSVIAQYPPTTDWGSTDGSRGNKGTLNIPLPMGLQNTCSLVIKAADAENKLDALLGPVSSILALQLNRSVVVDPSSHQEIKKLVEACEMWDEYSHGDVRRAVQDVGLDPRKEIGLVVADVSGEFHATSWRLRVALHEAFNVVRVTDIDDRLIAFTQSPRDDLDTISHTLLSIQSKQPVVVKLPTASLYQLRMSLVHSLQLVEHIERPQIAPSLGLGAVVAATAGRGARESAQNFLRPLVEHDEMRAGQLVETLNAFLRHDARPTPTCAELFIHRNSLNYRIRKISDLLMVDLNSVEGQATCLIALKLDELGEK